MANFTLPGILGKATPARNPWQSHTRRESLAKPHPPGILGCAALPLPGAPLQPEGLLAWAWEFPAMGL